MNDILRALGRALVSLLHPRMLWLTAMPFCFRPDLGGRHLVRLGAVHRFSAAVA